MYRLRLKDRGTWRLSIKAYNYIDAQIRQEELRLVGIESRIVEA